MRRGFAARKKRAAVALSLVFLCLFSACAMQGRNASKPTWLTVGTADAGGSMYANGSELAAAITARDAGLRFNLKASTGSPGNLKALLSGEVDLALITADIAAKAREEAGGEELRVIAAIYPSVSHWMALRESGIVTVSELKGTAIAIGPENSSTEHASEAVLAELRFPREGKYYYAGIGHGAELVERGEVKAVHALAGVPTPGLKKLASTKDSVLLRYESAELDKILSGEAEYFPTVIPKSSYPGQEEDIPSFGVKCLLCVRADMDETLVYRLTKLLYESLPELAASNPSFAGAEDKSFYLEDLPLPLHPGALRYYREQGLTEDKER